MFGLLKAPRTFYQAALLVCVSAASNSGRNVTDSGSTKTVIYMGGFFAFPENPFLATHPGIVQTAIDHVNSLEGILDDYHLRMKWNWTGADDPERALEVLYSYVQEEPPVVIALGPHHLTQAAIVNQVAARYNIVQMGQTADETLTDRDRYPYTVQTLPNYDGKLLAGAAFFRRMGWRRVAFIFEEHISFQSHTRDFRKILEANDIQVVASEGIKDIANLDLHLQNLKVGS
ncbi:gamma-aminobutyric acid type B receptor subunit 2-like [Acanthaster planci]|uniref:Gamma-aminobutyric acid type B receptor subunit 2-like n=1 Tax=Acanthaster planci TaxID=133434 RepID=A0A8B7Y823_ACAPL|nr:gamma-aminobutyric acid type B receptor subunit 2-like [Acanthaster planci]